MMSLLNSIIFMITGHRRMDIEMVQQTDTVSGILRCDQIRFLQHPHRPKSHIFQIPDGCRAQIQSSAVIYHLA